MNRHLLLIHQVSKLSLWGFNVATFFSFIHETSLLLFERCCNLFLTHKGWRKQTNIKTKLQTKLCYLIVDPHLSVKRIWLQLPTCKRVFFFVFSKSWFILCRLVHVHVLKLETYEVILQFNERRWVSSGSLIEDASWGIFTVESPTTLKSEWFIASVTTTYFTCFKVFSKSSSQITYILEYITTK